MGRGFAVVISYLLHPLLMPSYLFGLLLYVYPDIYRPLNYDQAMEIILRLSIVTLILPALSISILRLTGYIGSVHLEERTERLVPYMFTCLYYGVLTYIFYSGMSFHPFFVLMASMTALILVLALVNLSIKVSAHAAALTGIIGFVMALKVRDPDVTVLYPVAATIFVAGLVMSARLYINAHRPMEIYLGAILGLVVCFAGGYYFM